VEISHSVRLALQALKSQLPVNQQPTMVAVVALDTVSITRHTQQQEWLEVLAEEEGARVLGVELPMVLLEQLTSEAVAEEDPPVTGAEQTGLISAQLEATVGPVLQCLHLPRTSLRYRPHLTGASVIDPKPAFSLRLFSLGTPLRTT
jgi:hypothetical protein